MKASTAKISRCRDCPDCEISRINNPQGHCTRLDKGLYAGVWMVDRNCPRDDTLDAEMCLIVDGVATRTVSTCSTVSAAARVARRT